MSVNLVDQQTTLRLYRSGVSAIETRTAAFTDLQWHVTACGSWTGEETARHVLAVAGWYHQWLDRALVGKTDPPFPESHMAGENETAMATMADRDGPNAVAEFADVGRHYADRVTDHWDLPFGYPFGTVTAGLHAGAAAAEWHLHAWDLARSIGEDHEPDDPESLLLALGDAVTTARGGLAGRLGRKGVRFAGGKNPWGQIVRQSGRKP